MAITQCTVYGNMFAPDAAPAVATVTFDLTSAYDVQSGEGVVLDAYSIETALTSGAVSVDLWPNSEGYAGTRYSVTVYIYATDGDTDPTETLSLGEIEVPSTSTANISSLLPVISNDTDDLTYIAGSTIDIAAQYLHDNGSPQSLDGISPRSQMRLSGGDLIDLTYTEVYAPDGFHNWSLSADDSKITAGEYEWDAIYPHENGTVDIVRLDNITIIEGITE